MAPNVDKQLSESIRRTKFIAFDFDGVFTDNTVYVHQEGGEMVRCWRSDGLGLKKLARLGVDKVILSTEKNPVVAVRSKKLGIECYHGLSDKLIVLNELIEKLGISLSETAFVGNDINDIACLKAVGLAIVVQDAHPDVNPWAHYRTQALGGKGAVREICDLFETIRDTEASGE